MSKCPDCDWKPSPACPTYSQHCRVCEARADRLLMGKEQPTRRREFGANPDRAKPPKTARKMSGNCKAPGCPDKAMRAAFYCAAHSEQYHSAVCACGKPRAKRRNQCAECRMKRLRAERMAKARAEGREYLTRRTRHERH